MKQTEARAVDSISTVWKLSGFGLFSVALLTPLMLIGGQAGSQGSMLDDLDNLAITKFLGSEEGPSLLDQADDTGEYPEVALLLNNSDSGETEMGSLAKLIDEQGPTFDSDTRDVRRMVLDAVSVDLESSSSVDALDHLSVPISDCSSSKAEAYLIENGSEISARIEALPKERPSTQAKQIAGPPARSLMIQYDGLHVVYCADGLRIAHVEVLPTELRDDPHRAFDLVLQDQPADVEVSIPQGIARLNSQSTTSVTGDAPRTIATLSEHPSLKVLPTVPGSEFVDPEGTNLPNVTTTPIGLLALNGGGYLVSKDLDPTVAEPDLTAKPRPLLSETELSEIANVAPAMLGPTITDEVAATELDLRLNRSKRWQTQLRLALIGHDPKGIDGIFGPGTRNAIMSLQRDAALPQTGYLDDVTLAFLEERSNPAYRKWRSDRKKRRAAKARPEVIATAPKSVNAVPTARSATECARDKNGIIISNQSFGCDLNVLQESLSSLFKS